MPLVIPRPSGHSRAMRILLCNDDGIHAPGIAALHEALQDLGDVHVVAPEAERSAVGHAITIYQPLRVKKVEKQGRFFGYAVDGTPADCVKIAINALLPEPPDLVVSGINLGPNAGVSVVYSGTVSAATEGTILGIPSIAMSLATFTDPIWETPQAVAREMVQRVMQDGLPADTLLNVNVPNRPYAELKGCRATRIGRSRFVETFEERRDPRNHIYYWMDGEMALLEDPVDTDIHALDEGYVSLSPIGLDLTRHAAMAHLNGWTTPLPPPAS
jgi:5'-nucleotidase